MAIINTGDFSADLNIIGVVSLFGGEVALSALRYTILVRDTWTAIYFSMIVSAGLQAVSLKMFKRMDDRVSAAISPGIRDDSKEMVGLAASGRYKYFGIHSGTKMPFVASMLGESVLRHSHNKEISVICTRDTSPDRNIRLKVIQLGSLNDVAGKCINTDAARFGIIYFMPLITIAGIVMTILIGDYYALVIVVLNVVCNMLVIFSVRADGIKYPSGGASSGSPHGHAFMDGPDDVYLVLGHEDVIQYLFQKPLVVPPKSKDKWESLQRFVAYFSYIIVIANIIAIPFATLFGQLIFGILMLSGLFQNIMLATRDGDKLLHSIATDVSTVEHVDEYVFQPWAAMAAFCALVAKAPNDNFLRRSLPETSDFATWFKSVTKCVEGGPPPGEEEKHGKLLSDLNADLRDACREYKEYIQRHGKMADV
jgi:hypothetical protein